MRMLRLNMLTLIICSQWVLADTGTSPYTQVATITVQEPHSLVREILGRVIAPQRQVIAAETHGVVISHRLEMGTQRC